MKKNHILLSFLFAFLVLLSCDDQNYDSQDYWLFIESSLESPITTVEGSQEHEVILYVGMHQFAPYPFRVNYLVDQGVLTQYNEINKLDLQLLPSEYYRVEEWNVNFFELTKQTSPFIVCIDAERLFKDHPNIQFAIPFRAYEQSNSFQFYEEYDTHIICITQ